MPLRIVQANLNHVSAAQNLFLQTVAERGVDLGIVAEPYRIPSHLHWAGDTEGLAAVVWGGRPAPPNQETRRWRGFRAREMGRSGGSGMLHHT